MFCKQCGNANPDHATNCQNCGAPLAGAAPVQSFDVSAPQTTPGKGFAITSLVLGIVSLLCFAIIAGPLAIIFGAVAKSKGCSSGMATAGIVLGVVGLVLYVLMLVVCGGGMFYLPY